MSSSVPPLYTDTPLPLIPTSKFETGKVSTVEVSYDMFTH